MSAIFLQRRLSAASGCCRRCSPLFHQISTRVSNDIDVLAVLDPNQGERFRRWLEQTQPGVCDSGSLPPIHRLLNEKVVPYPPKKVPVHAGGGAVGMTKTLADSDRLPMLRLKTVS